MFRKVFTLILIAALAAVSGCAAIQNKFNQDVQAATLPDVEAAVASATAAGDVDGAACWQDVADYIKALPTDQQGAAVPVILGVASGIEAARIAAQAASQGVVIPPIPAKLHKDCAVLVVDAQQLALKIGLNAAALKSGLGVVKAGAALKGQAAALRAAEAALAPKP